MFKFDKNHFLLILFLILIIFINFKLYFRFKEGYNSYQPIFYISDSSIQGKGVFAEYDIPANRKIGIGFYERIKPNGTLYGKVDENFGAYINHCQNSNTYLKKELDIWWIVSARNIFKGEEITANYWNTPDYIEKPSPAYTQYC